MDYDVYTGQELPATTDKRLEAEDREANEELEDFKSLSTHPGWKRIVTLIKEDLEKDLQALLHTRHPETVLLFQERAKARRDFLTWLEAKIVEHNYFREEKQAQA